MCTLPSRAPRPLLCKLALNTGLCLKQIVPGFRVRTIPVLGTTPAVFGMAAAAHILCALAGAPLATEPLIRLQAEQYAVQLARLAAREELLYGSAAGVAVDIDDVRGMLMWPVDRQPVACFALSLAAVCEIALCAMGRRCMPHARSCCPSTEASSADFDMSSAKSRHQYG